MLTNKFNWMTDGYDIIKFSIFKFNVKNNTGFNNMYLHKGNLDLKLCVLASKKAYRMLEGNYEL